jgi:cell division protein YceG involved in septum cleavage
LGVAIAMSKTREGIIFYILFFILIIGLTLIGTSIMKGSNYQEEYVTVTINNGDTLWGINESSKEFHQYSFVEFIEWVEEVNNINTDQLKPGDEIIVPIKNTNKQITTFASTGF